jgi:NDP-sugar pyrophosphorylase family protein
MTAPADLAGATAVVLAGGLGTRLRAAVADRPKVLAEVQGRPFLAYLLDRLAAAGVAEIVLCTGYLGEQVRATFGATHAGCPLTYVQERRPLGTAGALRRALRRITSDPLLVLNGDSYCPADLDALWAWHAAHSASATLVLAPAEDTRRYGQVVVDGRGCVQRFLEKDAGGGPGWVSAGIYVLSRRVLADIPVAGAASLERQVFPAWVGRGLYGLCVPGPLLDIGTVASYRAAQDFGAWV